MLDRSKLIAELQKVADHLFIDRSNAQNIAHTIWKIITQDPCFINKVRATSNPPWPVPLWHNSLGDIIPTTGITAPYIAVSIDGSQIYPDRHTFISCFLINTGSVVIPYLMKDKKVTLTSNPTIFVESDQKEIPFTTDTVNCKRQELELKTGLELAKKIDSQSNNITGKSVTLFDGSLIFWHLSAMDIQVRDYFLQSYFGLLNQMYHEKILTCWYISLPKSKELINLIRLYLCDFDPSKKELYEHIEPITDCTIMEHFLPPYSRSTLFSNRSTISRLYPENIKPYFFYIHTGIEIGRVEIPEWIAKDNSLVDYIASIIIDQSIKGNGYPLVLAEAHEQAVVKGPDREFFYHFLQKMVIERKKTVVVSRKSLKKRGMGV